MKVLVTGANGQLGYDVIKRLNALGDEPVGADREEFDITDEKATEEYITSLRPDAVVHCAAYTAVDKAEDDRDACRKVNVDGTRNIALACEKIGAKLVYISSDYVFGGSGTQPLETDAPKNPQNIYGITKLGGEKEAEKCKKHFIIRTSWVFGINGGNFVKTMLRLADSHDSLTVVDDQTGSPTYTPDLARLICDMIKTEKYGTYHASNEGFCTWAQFASGDDKWRKLLDHLKGKEITSAGHLSAQNFSFGEEIIELDGKLNFYLQADFDVDAAFGTFVCTDQNDDWLNIYANYDMEQDHLCDTLELNLCKGDGSEERWSYPLNAAEQEVLLNKVEAFCQQQTGMSLHEYARQLRGSETQAPEMQM